MRGIWVVRSSLTSPAQIRNVVDEAYAHNFNTLFVQVRGRGDAYYDSKYEPRAEELSKEPLSFDPLATVIKLAHAKGLQVHAWMNTCFVWGDTQLPKSPHHVVRCHPDWLARDASGKYILGKSNDCEGAFLSPANLAARQHIHDVFIDVVRKYDIDGLHFDYVRYPNASYDYSTAALFRFRLECQPTLPSHEFSMLYRRNENDRLAFVHAMPQKWADFRRRQITDMVRDISRDTKSLKPWVEVSAAVFADSQDAYTLRGQDWKSWLRHGYLDAVIPMAYGANTLLVEHQIEDAVKTATAAHRFAYAGLGSWHIPVASTIAKIDVARASGAQGTVLFSFGGITKDGTSSAYLNELTAQRFKARCSPPELPWLSPHVPQLSKSGPVRVLNTKSPVPLISSSKSG